MQEDKEPPQKSVNTLSLRTGEFILKFDFYMFLIINITEVLTSCRVWGTFSNGGNRFWGSLGYVHLFIEWPCSLSASA